MNNFWYDIKCAFRSFRSSTVLAVACVVVLAMGLGAAIITFTVINRVLLRPLPYDEPDGLVSISMRQIRFANPLLVTNADYLDVASRSRFIDAAAMRDWTPTLSVAQNADGPVDQVRVLRATPNLFQVLRARPKIGRVFHNDEGQVGNDRVVVLSYDSWQRRWAGRTDILGRAVFLNGQPFTIVGVMPAGSQLSPFSPLEMCVPLSFSENDRVDRLNNYLSVIGRLRPGGSIGQARGELRSIAEALSVEYPDTNKDVSMQLDPLKDRVVGAVKPILTALFAVVAILLVLVCANVANLHLVRAEARARDFAIRAALGAGSGRIIRAVLVESVVLATCGALLGLIFAWWGTISLPAVLPSVQDFIVPREAEIRVDGATLAFGFGLAVLIGIVFGLAPALRLSRPARMRDLREGERTSTTGPSRARIFGLLVAFQLALAVCLLSGSGLLLKTFRHVQNMDPGFRRDNLLTFVIPVDGSRYHTTTERAMFAREFEARLRALPDVISCGAINEMPIGGDWWNTDFTPVGEVLSSNEVPNATWRAIDPGYFTVMGTPLKRGRFFADSDMLTTTAVAIVNEALARRVWPNADPIGKRIKPGPPSEQGTPLIVVGVVPDMKQKDWAAPSGMEYYIPLTQSDLVPRISFAVRYRRAGGLVPVIRRELRSLDPALPLTTAMTMDQIIADAQWQIRLTFTTFNAFSVLALLLAFTGLYSVVSHSVQERTKEIAIRRAFGADRVSVIRLMLVRGMGPAWLGILVGLLMAFAETRSLRSLLNGVSDPGPWVFVGSTLLVGVVALVANCLSCRTAVRADLTVALRQG